MDFSSTYATGMPDSPDSIGSSLSSSPLTPQSSQSLTVLQQKVREWLKDPVYHEVNGYKEPFPSMTADVSSPTPYTDALRPWKSATAIKKKAKDHTSRAVNGWMLYRMVKKSTALAEETRQDKISVDRATMWNTLDQEIRDAFNAEYRRLDILHKIEFPDYKFKPQKKNSSGKKRKASDVDDLEEEPKPKKQPKKQATPRAKKVAAPKAAPKAPAKRKPKAAAANQLLDDNLERFFAATERPAPKTKRQPRSQPTSTAPAPAALAFPMIEAGSWSPLSTMPIEVDTKLNPAIMNLSFTNNSQVSTAGQSSHNYVLGENYFAARSLLSSVQPTQIFTKIANLNVTQQDDKRRNSPITIFVSTNILFYYQLGSMNFIHVSSEFSFT